LEPLETLSLKRQSKSQVAKIRQVQRFYCWNMHNTCKIMYSGQCTVRAIHLLICRGNGTVRSFKQKDVVKRNEPVVSCMLIALQREMGDKSS
jgi:hypothetical protein